MTRNKPAIFHISFQIKIQRGLSPLRNSPRNLLFIHKEIFNRMMTPFGWGQFTEGVPPMLISMNTALKELAEKFSN